MSQTPIYQYQPSLRQFVQDPNALTNIKLKDNEEIRIKKIYHINKPYEEPPEAPKSSLRDEIRSQKIATKLAIRAEREQNESVFGSRELSEASDIEEEVDDNFSTISNAGSEKKIRKRAKPNDSVNSQLKRYSIAYVPPCPICNQKLLVMSPRRSLPATLPPLPIGYKVSSPTKKEGKRLFSPHGISSDRSTNRLKSLDSHAHTHLKLENNKFPSKSLNQLNENISYKKLFQNRKKLIDFTYKTFNPQNQKYRY